MYPDITEKNMGGSIMSFGENLQYLRKKENITQEQLAERMEVSRQTISKWESDTSYPEMDKILSLCEMFGCTMDSLLRGSVESENQEDKEIYDKHMNSFINRISGAVSVLIAGLGLTSIVDGVGRSERVEILVFFSILIVTVMVIVINGIQHEEFRKRYPVLHVTYSQEELDEGIRKFPIRIGTGIGMILMGLLWVGVFDGMSDNADNIMGGIFLVFVAVGARFLIYGGMQREKLDVEKYNQENNPDSEQRKRSDRTGKWCGCIMILAALVYVLLGFLRNAWDTAWVVFVAGGMLCGVAAIIIGKTSD